MSGIFIRTIPNVMKHYGCERERAIWYIELRDEGYSPTQAALIAGISDPPDPDDITERQMQDQEQPD